MEMNVLVLGSGSIAQKHIKNLVYLRYKVYVYSNNINHRINNKKIKRILNFKNPPKFDFAIIANSTFKHYDSVKFLIKKKIHFYCEKPIYHKKFNYLKIRKQLKKNKIIFHSGYQLLKDSKVEYIKKKLKNLKVKSFIASVGHDFTKWRKNKIRKNSYYINTSKGGGVIFELVHEINLISNLFGKILNIKTFKTSSSNFKCEDIATSIISTEKKIIGTLYQDMYSRFFFRNLKIITDKKNYIIDFEKNIVLENKKIIKFKDSNSQMILLKKNLKEFIKKIKKNDYSLKNFDNSVLDLKNCLKMHIKI